MTLDDIETAAPGLTAEELSAFMAWLDAYRANHRRQRRSRLGFWIGSHAEYDTLIR